MKSFSESATDRFDFFETTRNFFLPIVPMGHIGHIGITCYEESGQRDFGLRRIRRANLRGDVNAHTLIMRCMYMRER